METYIASKDELYNTIQDAVRRTVSELLPDLIKKSTQKKYLTKREVMQLLNVSAPTLQRMRDERRISFIQDGRSILYPYADLIAYLESKHIKVIGE